MAVTAVYASLTRIPLSAQDAPEQKAFSNIGATTAAFGLSGGKYRLRVVGATFGTVTLQELADDASTYLTSTTALSASGCVTLDLAAGTYKLALA